MTKSTSPQLAPAGQPSDAAPAKPKADSFGKAVRETIESVVIAFVLAFMFRTFEAEAFVIPTGSMAPTLQGRHFDVACTKCGFRYRAGASQNELWQNTASDPDLTEADRENARLQIMRSEPVAVTCPYCRYALSVAPDTPGGEENPPFNGDRILVAKFPYDCAEPSRWDVFVFKYPGDAKMNYIKRLVGLPNQSLRIFHGDIYTKGVNDPVSELKIVRKPAAKLRAMLQHVYDNDYLVEELTAAGWPLRWQSQPVADAAAWSSSDGGHSFAQDGKAAEPVWLRYRHFVPSRLDWRSVEKGQPFATKPRPQLITDFYAYNDVLNQGEDGRPPNHTLGLNWVGDLKIDCELKVDSAQGSVIFELIKAGRHFQATIDLATGKAVLGQLDRDDFHPQATTSCAAPAAIASALPTSIRSFGYGSTINWSSSTAPPNIPRPATISPRPTIFRQWASPRREPRSKSII